MNNRYTTKFVRCDGAIPLSVLISFSIFLVFGLLAYQSFIEVKARHDRQLPTLGSFSFGESFFRIDYQEQTVGYVGVETKGINETVDVYATGRLLLSFQEENKEIEFSLNVHVNSVGQLGASIFRIALPNAHIAIGTGNINPIKVTVKIDKGGQVYSFSRQVPGPILGETQSDGKFRLVYAGSLNKFLGSNDSVLPQRIPLDVAQISLSEFEQLRELEMQPLVVENMYQLVLNELLSLLDTIKQINPSLVPPGMEKLMEKVQQP